MLNYRQVVGFDMTKQAVEKLHKQTGYYPKDVQVIELHDCFSANELITYEALGLCPVGRLNALILPEKNYAELRLLKQWH